MRVIQKGGRVEVTGVEEFDLARIFECGQCFRWNADEDGSYVGVALGRAARISPQGGGFVLSGTAEEFEAVWRPYFDLDRDYGAIRRAVSIDGYMAAAARHGAGIRILRQDRWEALCSFIVSQCNNIPRIKAIVETLCRLYGRPIEFEGKTQYTFPEAKRLSALSPEDLAPLRCGYRAPYIIGAARAVADGRIDLSALADGSCEDALRALRSLRGVGDKVAACTVLFGLNMLDAFPVDTWMKKALAENYGDGFDPSVFGPYAGIAQQYMFFYARSGGDAAST